MALFFLFFIRILRSQWCGYIEMNCDSPEKQDFSRLASSLEDGSSDFLVDF